MSAALAAFGILSLLPSPARAFDPCLPRAGEGEVVRIAASRGPDGRIDLADGRRLRLAGLDAATLALPDLAGRQAIVLASAGPDRFGDLRGDIVIEGEFLSEIVLAQGRGRVRPAPGDGACYATLLATEDAAREASLGLWADPYYAIADASDPAAIAQREGRFTIMSGRVRHVGRNRGQVWIDFGDHWLSDVTLALPEKEWSRFAAAGVNPEALEGRFVRVRGIVRLRDGPRIDITEPAAIERLPEDVAGVEER